MTTKTIDEILLGFDMEIQPIEIGEPSSKRKLEVKVPELLPSGFKDIKYNVYGPFAKYIDAVGYEILSLDKFQLERRVKPKIVDHKIKAAFLNELMSALKNQSEMTYIGVFRDVCGREVLHKRISNPEFVAWLMEPLADPEKDYNAIIAMGIQHMEQVMNANTEIVDENGEVTGIDLDVSAEKMKIIKFVTDRTQGQAVARTEVKKLSISLSDQNVVDRYKLKDPTNLREIEEKLKMIREDRQYGGDSERDK